MPCSLTQVSPTTTTRRGFAPTPSSFAGDITLSSYTNQINRLVTPFGYKVIVLHSPPHRQQENHCPYTRHLSGHSFVVPIITIHASASKPVQCGNWLTTLAGDSQSLIHRINFEICETAAHWRGLFLLGLGTIRGSI